ncbi:hypothetical protein K0U27_02920 [archaeon]|nr:hypothetical protein [archaeon]
MINELLKFFNVFEYLYAPHSPYVIESTFTLMFSGFVLSMYIAMKVKKRRSLKDR